MALEIQKPLSGWERAEEIANVITHGIGALLSPLALYLLLATSLYDSQRLLAVSLFGLSIVLLYVTSTIYHAVSCPIKKRWLRTCDHCAIYLLIAGSYTPIALVVLQKSSWVIFIWFLAILGIAFKWFYTGRFELLSTCLYLGMGWLVVIDIQSLWVGMPPMGLYLLIAGGLAYSVGALIYLLEKPLFHHAIWHLFVLAGTSCHYLCILFYLS